MSRRFDRTLHNYPSRVKVLLLLVFVLLLSILPLIGPQLPFTTTSSSSNGLVGTAHANGWASTGNLFDNTQLFGNTQTGTYIDPSYVTLPDGSYQYTTSFGTYRITYRPILNLYTVAYAASDGTPLVTASTYALLEDSTGDWKFIRAQPLRFTISSPTAKTSNARFEADWVLTYRPTSQQLGTITFRIDFDKSAYPKQSVSLQLDTYQVDPSCVEPICARGTYWNKVGLRNRYWLWLVAPSSDSKYVQASSKQETTLSTISSSSPLTDFSHSTFKDATGRNWYADWSTSASQQTTLEPSTSVKNILGQPILSVPFAVNVDIIDPTFGLTSTGSTSYPTAKTAYPAGTAQINTAQSKFGGASGRFSGSYANYLYYADSSDWNLGSSFTIDFWMRYDTFLANTSYIVYSQYGDANNYIFMFDYYDGSYNCWQFNAIVAGTGAPSFQGCVAIPHAGSWNHIALVRNGASWAFYENGTVNFYSVFNSGTGSETLPDINAGLGLFPVVDAWADEFRLSNGIARWTSNFTPPTARYDRDSNTVLLLPMDGADTSTTFLDDVTTGQALFSKFLLTETGTPTSMSVYSHAAGNMRLSISTDSSGPATKLCETADTAVTASAWTSPSISGCGTLSSGSYWLGLQWNPGTAYAAGPSYTAGSANTGYRLYMAYGAFPSSGAGGTLTSENYSIYATYTAANPLSVASTVSDIFVVNHDNFVNVTVADTIGRADAKNVTIQGSTNGGAQTFTLMWNQVTNSWTEVSDPSNIITINAAGSLNSTTNANTWVVDFKFKFTTGFTSGPVSVTSKVMNSAYSASATSTNLFNVGNINQVFVTFDDGFLSQYTNATSVLASNSITGTFYIIYDYRMAGYMSWTQVAQLVADGHEIGSHTRTHPHMNSLSSAQLLDETATVKNDFLTVHGITTLTFAYPFGEGWDNATVSSAINSAGYLYARKGGDGTVWSRTAGTKTAVSSYNVDSTDYPGLDLALFETWVNQAYDDTEVILVYHYIGEGSSHNVDLALFQQQMAYLHNKGFTTLGMSGVGSGIPITSQYYLTVTSQYGSPSPTSNWYDAGSSISASVNSPVSGGTGTQYACTGWTGSGSVPATGSSCSTSFTINAASSITWNWKTQYYLTIQVNPSDGGTTSPASNWYDSGQKVSIQAVPASGYGFSSWSGSGSGSYTGTNNPASVTINSPTTETANFAVPTVTLSPSSAPPGYGASDGTISVSGQGFSPGSARSCQLTSTPAGLFAASPAPTCSISSSGIVTGSFAVSLAASAGYTVRVTDTNPAGVFAEAGFTVLSPPTLNPPTPASGPTGTTVTLTSSAPFAVQDAGPCTITSSPAGLISSPTCSIDSSGNLASSFVVSANAPGGIYSLTVTGLHGDYASTSFTVTAQITLSPTSGSPPVGGSPGTEVTVSGSGFKPSQACTISAQAGLVVDTSGEPACNVNANGLLSAKFKVGAGSTYSVGYIVTVTGPGGDSATGTFSVNPRIVLSPNSGSTGVSVSVKGSGFTPNAGSCSLTGMPVSGGLTCNQAGDGTVAGQFSVARVTAGLYPITVNDAAGTPSASATFTITSGSVISLSPSMGPTGTTVTVSGSGWNPADTSVTFANAGLFDGTKTCVVSGGSIASGCSFTVKSTALGGIWTVTFTGTLGDSAQAQFTVQSTFIVNPNNGGPGTTGTLSGSGYTTTVADCGGDISASPPLFSSTRCAIDSNGIITGTFTVAASASSGSHTVTISGAEVEQGSISVTFTVTPPTMSVSYSVVGGGTPTAPVFHYVLNGVTKSLTLSKTSKPVSVDAGTTWSVTPNPLGGSTSSQRWYSNQPLTGTASSTTVVFTFYRQTLQTLSYSVSGGGSGYSSPTFQTNQFGSSSTVTLTTTATKYWLDYGSTWTAGPNPLAGSTSSERWFTTQTITGTIGSSSTGAFKYQHQFYLTMQVTPSGSGTVTPSSDWYNAGQSVTIRATAKTGHRFQSWTGTGTGSYTGTSSSHTITMNSPITETAKLT